MIDPVPITEEKLEEYVSMLKRGEVDLDEVTAGLIAVHGATRVEMTQREFLDYLRSTGLPLVMSDELRKEFEARIKNDAKD